MSSFILPAVLFNAFVNGLGWGWTAPTILYLQQADSVLPITGEQASWIGSISEMGRMCSPFILPFILDRVGRKYYVILSAVLYLTIWMCQIFVRDVFLLCLMRLIFGLSTGIHDVISSIYTTENCSTTLRGIIGSSVIVTFLAGYVVQLSLATYLAYRTVAILSTIVALSAVGTMYFCVETPYYLIMKEKFYEAEQNLVWLRGGEISQNHLSNVLENLKLNVQEENRKKASIKMLFASKANYKSMYMVLVLYAATSATGYGAIVSYSSIIFSASQTLTSNHFSIMYGVITFLAMCTAPFIMKIASRRKLIIITFIIHFLSNFSVFLLLSGQSSGCILGAENISWFVFVSIVVYGIVRAVQFPAIFVIRGELLPASVRATGGSLAVAATAAAGFGVSKMFHPITETLGMQTNFLVYASVSMLTTIFAYSVLPETEGKSLDEIQRSLEGKETDSNT